MVVSGEHVRGIASYPKDLKRRADINRWLLWEGSTWFPSCYTYLVEYVVKPLLNDKTDEAIIGGLVARIGSTIFDGSVQSHLDRLANEMAGR